jgi:DNA-binding IclR family transcriptional regulator
LWLVHQLVDHLARNGSLRQDSLRAQLGGDQADWRRLVEGLERVRFISREGDDRSRVVRLATRLGDAVAAICPACGERHSLPKRDFLAEVACPHCNITTWFTIVADA